VRVYYFGRNICQRSSNEIHFWSFVMSTIHLVINGRSYGVDADPQTSLLTVLREHLDLTGTKYGCGEGQCGACTVLIDGKAQRSCMTKVGVVGAKQITTIEGIAKGEQLHPVQEAFLEVGAMQCAYCTSGMIISAVALGARGALDGGEPNAQLLRRQERDASRGSLRSFGAQKTLAQDDNDVLTGSSASAAKGAGR
jgi:aerobic-type carbon monoxide dehydrogenase small subunit (CoxS/CutS family)